MAIDIQSAFSPRNFAGMGTTPAPTREEVEAQFWADYEARTSGRGACEYPAWCDWIGGMDRFFDSCRPFTEAELRECQRAEFGSAMPPASIEEALRRGDESVAAYLRMHPEEAQAYQEALADPTAPWSNLGWAALTIGVTLLERPVGV